VRKNVRDAGSPGPQETWTDAELFVLVQVRSFAPDHAAKRVSVSVKQRYRKPEYPGEMEAETLEQVAERLGWSPERLAAAQARVAEPRPSNVSDRDRARAEALSESVNRTRQAVDAAS
jgi:hypothetical protein